MKKQRIFFLAILVYVLYAGCGHSDPVPVGITESIVTKQPVATPKPTVTSEREAWYRVDRQQH